MQGRTRWFVWAIVGLLVVLGLFWWVHDSGRPSQHSTPDEPGAPSDSHSHGIAGRPDRSGAPDGGREGELTIDLVAGTTQRTGFVSGQIAVIDDRGDREAEKNFSFVWKRQQVPPLSMRFILHVAPGEKQVVLWSSIPFGVRVYAVHVDPDASLRIDADELPKQVVIGCGVVDADGFPIPYFVVTATYQTAARIRSRSSADSIMERIYEPRQLHPALPVVVDRTALFPDGRVVVHFLFGHPIDQFVYPKWVGSEICALGLRELARVLSQEPVLCFPLRNATGRNSASRRHRQNFLCEAT
jgi:hypothetical protein